MRVPTREEHRMEIKKLKGKLGSNAKKEEKQEGGVAQEKESVMDEASEAAD